MCTVYVIRPTVTVAKCRLQRWCILYLQCPTVSNNKVDIRLTDPLAKCDTHQLASLSAEFLDTGQGSLPPVEWNGREVSGGGLLYYCPAMAKCKFKCMADSDLTPSFAINGRCYPVTELPKAFGGARVERQHPYYTFEHNCTSGMRFRCVNSQSRYSPSYTSGGCFCTCTCTHMCAHKRERERERERESYTANLLTIEVGSRGFLHCSSFDSLYRLVPSKRHEQEALEADIVRACLQESYRIWCKRNWKEAEIQPWTICMHVLPTNQTSLPLTLIYLWLVPFFFCFRGPHPILCNIMF